MFTSLKPEVRKRWMELLKIYFDTFQETLEKLKFKLSVTFEVTGLFEIGSVYACSANILLGMDLIIITINQSTSIDQ
jgi:hypothetical protein